MMRSPGMRFLIVGLLTLLMFIPLLMVSEIVSSRRSYSDQTVYNVGREWGGRQLISGPLLVLPVQEEVRVTVTRDVIDPATGRVMVHEQSGQPVKEVHETTEIKSREPVYMFPDRFDTRLTSATQIRHRGIFQVPVYQAQVEMDMTFPLDRAAGALVDNEEILWDQARLLVEVTSNHALRGEAVLRAETGDLALEPSPSGPGIEAALGDPRALGGLHLSLGLNGAEELQIAAVGRNTRVEMQSDWPDPSFQGAFLPDGSEISEQGFTATWTIPHLARNLPQVARDDYMPRARENTDFGVGFYQPNDFYQKAWRASYYGILFVALTFLTVLLIEGARERPVHPVQYILIGLAQAIFTLLMLSYAEQIGFGPAYLLASGAVVVLLTLFALFGLKLGRRSWVLGLMLVVLYAVLYLILNSTDYALIAGSSLAFAALAATMFATRNEEWYGPAGPAGKGWLKRRKPAPPPPAAPHP
ncbi:MAG: hypothetical protein CSA74_09730 [Rhodobacterales bacterium]|nr:MAG: hypothetical protein CSA74_09730 [Rhodobacterales bacterium]